MTEDLKKCIDFLVGIGINVRFTDQIKENFLPGIEILKGEIILNLKNLSFPGDILHEAGHIAIVPENERSNLNADILGNRKSREAEEMMAIAWSYAACMHLGIDSTFVFHEGGYKGGGDYLAENFAQKRYIGLPMLQYNGLCYDEKNAEIHQKLPFPSMQKWLV